MFRYLLIFLVCLIPTSLFADYSNDYREASKEGTYWVITIGAPWCGYCADLEGYLGKLKNTKDNLIVTKLDISSPYAKQLEQMYLKNGAKPMFPIPDWVVFKYEKGKFIYKARYKGLFPEEKLENMIYK